MIYVRWKSKIDGCHQET